MDDNVKKAPNIIKRSFVYAVSLSLIVFFLCMTVFFGNLGPIPALIYSPIAFSVSFVVCLFVEALLSRKPAFGRKKAYGIAIVVICLIPTGFYLQDIYEENTQEVRMRHALPLTNEERLLLQSTRLNFRVAVVNKDYPPIATAKLIRDLQKTCLFREVGELDLVEDADLIVTMEGYWRNIHNGLSVGIRVPGDSGKVVYKSVYYKLNRFFGGDTDEDQYIDRLTVELIDASKTLYGESELITADSLAVTPDKEVSCRRR